MPALVLGILEICKVCAALIGAISWKSAWMGNIREMRSGLIWNCYVSGNVGISLDCFGLRLNPGHANISMCSIISAMTVCYTVALITKNSTSTLSFTSPIESLQPPGPAPTLPKPSCITAVYGAVERNFKLPCWHVQTPRNDCGRYTSVA